MAKVLVIDDNDTMREGMETVVSRMGHDALGASSGTQGMDIFKEENIDLVLTDLKMEGMDGLDVTKKCREADPDSTIVVITAFGTIETAVEAMKIGAFDFVQKPFSQEILQLKIRQALDYRNMAKSKERLEQVNRYLRAAESDGFTVDQMIGESQVLKDILVTVGKVAKGDSTVFISGESGTGKELIGRAIHQLSPRKDKPVIKVNCSALAEGIMESELFGHEKGSFTGAIRRKIGRFELADGGTLLLDEIGDISPMIQLKLLRVLQERQFERVGGQMTITVDVRIICATNKDLKKEVEKRNFREDLFYRLHIIPITVPPLRDRKSDTPLLANHFLEKLTTRTKKDIRAIDEAAMKALVDYSWPGNIRELENVIEQTMVLCDNTTITLEDLPTFVTKEEDSPSFRSQLGERPLTEIIEDMERSLIKEAYEKSAKVKTETAKLLGIKTSALYYKLEKYGLL